MKCVTIHLSLHNEVLERGELSPAGTGQHGHGHSGDQEGRWQHKNMLSRLVVTYMQLNVSIIYPSIFVQRIKMLSSCSSCDHVWPRPQCFKQKQGKFCLTDCACSAPVSSLQWTVILSHLGFSRGELRPIIS